MIMASNFTLSIKLGNAAMEDASAIAEALRKVSQKLDQDYAGYDSVESTPCPEVIWDANGARVGEWQITE
jgi:hypothetical protein